jgi:hypothetical protein
MHSVLTSLSRDVNSPLPLFATGVIERCGFCPKRCGNITTLRKSERPDRLRTCLPPHSTCLGPETDQNVDWVLWTMAWQDFSRDRVVCNSRKTGWKRGRRQSHAVTELLTKKCQNGCQNVIFCCHVRSSKRFGGRFCRNRSILNKSDIKEFCPEFDVKVGGQL